MDFDALMNKQMEQFRNIMIISPQQIVSRLEQMWTQSEDRLDKIEDEFSSLLPAERFREVITKYYNKYNNTQKNKNYFIFYLFFFFLLL